MFTQRLSSTPRGARLARHLALNQLHTWGIPHGTDVSDRVAVVVAELAANAVTHGRVPGRDFELRLTLTPAGVHVEVSDTRTDGAAIAVEKKPCPLEEAGRGLVLVGASADRWGVVDRDPPPGKTVWAAVEVPGSWPEGSEGPGPQEALELEQPR